jgi:hypothetical protein
MTQNLTPQSKEEAYILTKWCETHIDPKVQFVRLAEGLIENMEIEASDSVSNVSCLAFEADRDHDSIPSISRDNIIRDNLSQPSDVSQRSKMSKVNSQATVRIEAELKLRDLELRQIFLKEARLLEGERRRIEQRKHDLEHQMEMSRSGPRDWKRTSSNA